MCGIVGAISLDGTPVNRLAAKLSTMGELIAHRGPDGCGEWMSNAQNVGLAHRRLTIIDLTENGAQPMSGPNDTNIVYNGEVYNYVELRHELESVWSFKSRSDTETILAAYASYGYDTASSLRGMFAFAIWDERRQSLYCARDRFGIKPFYYTVQDNVFYFASEAKALLPIMREVAVDQKAFSEYITFQYPISDRTLFKGIRQLMPGEQCIVSAGEIKVQKYWDLSYEHDESLTQDKCRDRVRELLDNSVKVHLRSDVPIGSYLSGGVDSSLIAILASDAAPENNQSFHGRFTQFPGYDESNFANEVADDIGNTLHTIDITADDFRNHISDVVYHLDYPVAGPGSFPQYMVSQLASKHVKVVLGGQGGDEVFGGYARYLAGYLEQLIHGALDGRLDNGHFGVSFDSVIPNLEILREYKPLLSTFFEKGLWESSDKRFLRLIDRSADMTNEVAVDSIDADHVMHVYTNVYKAPELIASTDYLNGMSRFDFKRLLPALLQVEDRMSMAHGLESRVPILDHPLVEFVATVPPKLKYPGGRLKELLRSSYSDKIPPSLLERRDKMGFPVPLKEWYAGELQDFVMDIFRSDRARQRDFMNSDAVLDNFQTDSRFSRKTWGLLSLELWTQTFVDQASKFRRSLADKTAA